MSARPRRTASWSSLGLWLSACAGPSSGLESDGSTSSESVSTGTSTTTTESEGDTGPTPSCGDGVVDPGEDCDDANTVEWDGCSSACAAGYRPDPATIAENLPPIVPVLRIDVDGQPIEKDVVIAGRIEIFEDHDGTLDDLDGLVPTSSTAIGFQGRGNYTWTLPKKGYAFELQGDPGVAIDMEILGLPPGSDFALYACYSDKTCMRNALVYALGQQLGRWSPRTRFVEVILDGEYLGLYMVWERVRRDIARCTVDKPAITMADGDVSGGYILRLEGAGKGPEVVDGMSYESDFAMSDGRVYTFHYPRPSDLSREQSTYVRTFMQAFQDAMVADPTVYPRWIDVPSWVDHAIVEEWTHNWDGYVHSIYMTKDSLADGGLLGMGPLWDYDLAFANGNVTGYNCQTDVWTHLIVRAPPDDVPDYWLALLADDEFRRRFKCRFRELRAGPLSMPTFRAQIEAWVAFTASARARDQAKWNTVGTSIFPNCFAEPTYEAEVSALLDWISARLDWLDAQTAAMPGACP